MKLSKRQFRIVTDAYNGYEVQIRYSLWPFWEQLGRTNTHVSVDEAEKYIEKTRYRMDFKSVEVKRFSYE